jgi:excisionase family DNA binding protein
MEMLTVQEAAKHTARNPETLRRWIRTGKLRAQKVGRHHPIDEQDLEAVAPPDMLPLPNEWGWRKTVWGDPMPNVAAWIRESRAGH